MENKRLSKQLKTPSPPARVKLFFENFDRKGSTSGNRTTNSESSSNHEIPLISVNNYGLNYVQDNENQPNNQLNEVNNQLNQPNNQLNKVTNQLNQPNNQLNKANNLNQQHNNLNHSNNNNYNNNSIQYGLKTEDYNNELPIGLPLSSESNRNSFTHRTKLSNTGDAFTDILKKYKELQAKSKVSLVLDDTDEEESNNDDDEQISDTPSFRYSSDEEEEEEEFCSSQSPQPNSLESSSSNKIKNNKLSQNQLNRRCYKSEPQLSSFEDSEDASIKNGGMYQDSFRYHSQTLKKSSNKAFQTITVQNVDYYILNLIGEGGTSKVYQVCDCKKNEFYALKIVNIGKAEKKLEILFKKEIEILNMLKDCKRVIKLHAYEWKKEESEEKLMLIMEKGDSDLSVVLDKMKQTDNNGSNPNKRQHLDLHTIKHYWNEMLKAVDEIHSKGIIHSDLKPVNFVIVKGYLKIIDFGIADAINPDHTSVIKSSCVGTINFMPPESLNSLYRNGEKITKVNQKSDVWSLGCILYTMIYGQTPFSYCETIQDKIFAILKAAIKYPPYEDPNAVDCVKRCLQMEQRKRPTVKELFDHPFLSNKDKLSTLSIKKPQPQTRVPIPARNPTTERNILQGLGFNPNDVSPKTLNRLKNVIKKEFPSIIKK